MPNESLTSVKQLNDISGETAYFIGWMLPITILNSRIGFVMPNQKHQAIKAFTALKNQYSQLNWQMTTVPELSEKFPTGSTPLIVVGAFAKGAVALLRSRYPKATILTSD